MKKTIKGILSTITAIAFVLVMSLSVLTFKSLNGNASTDGTPATEQGSGSNVSDGSGTENPTNPDPTPDTKPEVDASKFEGIYKFYNIPTFLDIYYDDYDKLITYFETTDLNGVYNAVKPLGYDEFVKNIKTNDEFHAFYVSGNEIKTLSYDNNGKYTLLNDIETFTFETNEGKITTSLGDKLKIEFDETTNTPTVYAQFYYVNTDSETVYTPLYIKYNLQATSNSVDVLEGKEYSYSKKSSNIVSTSTEQFDLNVKIQNLAKLLGLKVDEGANITEVIEAAFSANTYLFSEDGSRITIKGENSFSISKANENGEFVWNDATAKISFHEHNISTGIDNIVFSIQIDETTQFIFMLNA